MDIQRGRRVSNWCVFILSVAVGFGVPDHVNGQDATLDHLSIHGHMSQAFGITDGPQYLGIPSGGTADYRTAALQFRFDATDRDAMVIQLSHERLGLSPLSRLEPGVDLDWAFYERRFGDRTRVRVGKIVMPVGIYNEIRDVGVLLPLYRPPGLMYTERAYAVETLSGVSLHRDIDLAPGWGLTTNAFAGEWEYLQFDLQTPIRAERAVGASAWLSTPLPGLRIGGSALGYTVVGEIGAPEDHEDHSRSFGLALDGTFDRGFVRGEFRHGRWDFGRAENYYGELGLDIRPGLALVALADFADLSMDLAPFYPPDMPFPTDFDGNLNRDFALGVRWAPAYNLVLKLEAHRFIGYGTEDPMRDLLTEDPVRMHYGLLSVSTSF